MFPFSFSVPWLTRFAIFWSLCDLRFDQEQKFIQVYLPPTPLMMMTQVPELARSILATSSKKIDESPISTANTPDVNQKKRNMLVERPSSSSSLRKRKLNEENEISSSYPEESMEDRVISPKKKTRANSNTFDVLKREGISTPGALELESNHKETTTSVKTITFVPIPFDGPPAIPLKEEEVKILNYFLE